MSRHTEKGLRISLELSKKCQFRLLVAGTSNRAADIEVVSHLCDDFSAEYLGDVRGPKKAEVFARAKALIFPTNWKECCPLVIAESLVSGTPVIVSNDAACSEMICKDVGFVCNDENEYIHAINNIDSILPRKCKEYAIANYHYLHMANNYVVEYIKQIRDYGTS